MPLKYCPKCLDTHLEKENYCGECGTGLTLIPPLACPKCHTPLSRLQQYCTSCGTKVK